METLGSELQKEIARNQEILAQYPAGSFGARFICADLAEACKAMIEGDTVAMIRVYQKLKERTERP